MPFLPPSQQRQSTEGNLAHNQINTHYYYILQWPDQIILLQEQKKVDTASVLNNQDSYYITDSNVAVC